MKSWTQTKQYQSVTLDLDHTFKTGKYAGRTVKDLLKKDPSYLLFMKKRMTNITFTKAVLDKLKPYQTSIYSKNLSVMLSRVVFER